VKPVAHKCCSDSHYNQPSCLKGHTACPRRPTTILSFRSCACVCAGLLHSPGVHSPPWPLVTGWAQCSHPAPHSVSPAQPTMSYFMRQLTDRVISPALSCFVPADAALQSPVASVCVTFTADGSQGVGCVCSARSKSQPAPSSSIKVGSQESGLYRSPKQCARGLKQVGHVKQNKSQAQAELVVHG
jgi:hypothetical protein